MRLNIFVVSLFAVATLLQLANCLSTRRFDMYYMNEKENLNENRRFLVPSNNIPFKIQAMQTKNRPLAYGPSDPSSSHSPVTQQTSDTRPTSATNPSMATAPTSATNPSMATAPTSATNPSLATAPTSATNASMTTAPTSATKPSMATAPTSATNPSMTTAPTSATNPPSETLNATTTPNPHKY